MIDTTATKLQSNFDDHSLIYILKLVLEYQPLYKITQLAIALFTLYVIITKLKRKKKP